MLSTNKSVDYFKTNFQAFFASIGHILFVGDIEI